jgi:hypothetical protein
VPFFNVTYVTNISSTSEKVAIELPFPQPTRENNTIMLTNIIITLFAKVIF